MSTRASDAASSLTAYLRHRRLKRLLVTSGVVLLVLVGCCWTGLYFVQDILLYPVATFKKQVVPQQPTEPDALVFRADLPQGGSVPAWFYPAPGATARQPAPAVMLFHGNGEILGTQGHTVAFYRSLGWSALVMEYRGYGLAAGKPSQIGIRQDAVRFYDLLAARTDVDHRRIVFHGWSLGGAVAADLAEERKPAALILQSTFASAIDMAHRYYAPGFLVRNPYRSDRVVPKLGVPVLIFHGRTDTVIPVTQGRRLHQLAPGSKYIEFACGHDDFPGSNENQEIYRSALRDLLATLP